MDDNLKNLLISELTTATAYLERIFHVIIHLSGLKSNLDVRKQITRFHYELGDFLEENLFRHEYTNENTTMPEIKNVHCEFLSANQIMDSMILLDLNQEKVSRLIVDYINLVYKTARQLHLSCREKTQLQIEYPRTGLTTIIQEEDAKNTVACFQLKHENILGFKGTDNAIISSLEWQRNKKYDELVAQGHDAIFQKNNTLALSKFEKALNYKETAEVLTLAGWASHLNGNNEKAKSYCLKAIRENPNYGPPYNDLGTYLLGEDLIEEGLKWFEMAKKCSSYQNREYPYINAGRAYVAKKDFPRALEEFSKALTLAPFNDELHETVRKLKESLRKSTTFQGSHHERNT